MTHINVIEAKTRKQRKAFVLFPMRLYAGCRYYVPPLISDELGVFSRKKNPALEGADVKLFLAYRGSDVVGRIAAIWSPTANYKFKSRNLRFGWFDCVDDYDVADALFGAVEDWGVELGAVSLTGPQGFNDFDKTGMLIEGFETRPTVAGYYNHAYYRDLVERYGFTKDVDYVEFKLRNLNRDELPPRLASLVKRVKDRRRFRILEFPSLKAMLSRATEILDLVEDSYACLYGTVPLTKRERKYYISKYFTFLRRELVKVAVNEQDQIIGFLLAMPSLSEAFQRANGRLLPFGFIRLWRALRTTNKTVDFLLVGVKRAYRGRGVDLLLADAMHKSIKELGFEEGETNLELETNKRIQAECAPFDRVLHRRRRVYRKAIGQGGKATKARRPACSTRVLRMPAPPRYAGNLANWFSTGTLTRFPQLNRNGASAVRRFWNRLAH